MVRSDGYGTPSPLHEDNHEDDEGDELEDSLPIVPTIDTTKLAEREVDYDDQRAPGDFVISGPLHDGWGPGRRHATRARARDAAMRRFGDRVRELPGQTWGRWSFLVKAERDK
jgi:hypothetical protein